MATSFPIPTNKRFKDRAGQRFSRWTVIQYAQLNPGGNHAWLCRCDCGAERIISGNNLASGRSRSCGCLMVEVAKDLRTSHAMSGSPEYNTWAGMIQRCHNPSHRSYENYGGRGISVCEEWRNSFDEFFSHVGPKPTPSHSIDRIDNNGSYEPGNVRWATKAEQSLNRRARGTSP